MSLDSDVKTRVTRLDELKLPVQEGSDCLVVIYSSDARQLGRRQVLGEEPIRIGRGSENTIVLENDAVSRRHAIIERRARSYVVQDLQSTNGTYVNDQLVEEYTLRRGDQVKVGDTILKYLSGSDVEAQYHETIYRMTIVDGLTGAHNKRFLTETLEREMPRAARHGRSLSVVMFDIDHFKQINDSFGHLAGDYVLKELCSLVRLELRPDDVLCRYGGEEFTVVLPETARDGAFEFAERVRGLVEKHPFRFEDENIDVRISCGVAQIEDDYDVLRFLKAADERLYEAKNGGRNKVCG